MAHQLQQTFHWKRSNRQLVPYLHSSLFGAFIPSALIAHFLISIGRNIWTYSCWEMFTTRKISDRPVLVRLMPSRQPSTATKTWSIQSCIISSLKRVLQLLLFSTTKKYLNTNYVCVSPCLRILSVSRWYHLWFQMLNIWDSNSSQNHLIFMYSFVVSYVEQLSFQISMIVRHNTIWSWSLLMWPTAFKQTPSSLLTNRI